MQMAWAKSVTEAPVLFAPLTVQRVALDAREPRTTKSVQAEDPIEPAAHDLPVGHAAWALPPGAVRMRGIDWRASAVDAARTEMPARR
jgi:hypothetical protein